jgi:hypothetical protein
VRYDLEPAEEAVVALRRTKRIVGHINGERLSNILELAGRKSKRGAEAKLLYGVA